MRRPPFGAEAGEVAAEAHAAGSGEEPPVYGPPPAPSEPHIRSAGSAARKPARTVRRFRPARQPRSGFPFLVFVFGAGGLDGPGREPPPDVAVEAAEARERVQAAVGRLCPQARHAVTRRFGLDGRPPARLVDL